ncbi:MAG: hypothetical protein RL417_2596 [Pseudomonadota bacterium]
MLRILFIVPKRLLSAVVGRLAHLRLPEPLAGWVLRFFVTAYRIDTSTAELPLERYRSVGEFFTRNLAPGLRPIEGDLVSPVDGRVRGFGRIENGELEQIKGKNYSIAEFLGDERFAPLGDAPLAPRYDGGFYLNLYLAPPDYHHIHAPVGGAIRSVRAIPGNLWPVNDWSIRTIDKLFAVNERIVVVLETDFGLVTVVMVGATNVGEISLTFDSIRSNRWPAQMQRRVYPAPVSVGVGDRLGTFHLGSSVVVLFEPGRFPAERCRLQTGHPVRYGSSLVNRLPDT